MEKNNEEVALLVAQTGPLNGQRWALRNQLIIGRDATCDIVIPDRQVSRQHARLVPTSEGILLEDLGSKNGTHYNGQLLDEVILLQDGDIIQVALAQQLVFLSSDATVPLDVDEIDLSSLQPSGNQRAVATPSLKSMASEPDFGRLRLEKRSRRVWVGEKEVLPPLSVSQFRLLELLYEHQGKVVPRQELIADIWGEEQAVEVSEQAFDALVRRLRDRLANIDPSHGYIITVRGHGLRMENPPVTHPSDFAP